jgi:hypothetical protein
VVMHSKPPPKPSTFWTPSFRGYAARKGNSPGIGSGCPRPLPQRINTSDARGDQTRTSAWIPATTARRVRVEFGFPSGGCAHLDRSQPEARQPALRRTQDTCDQPGKKPRMPLLFPKPNGAVGSPARSTGGSLFLAVAAASVGSRRCDLDPSRSPPFRIPAG